MIRYSLLVLVLLSGCAALQNEADSPLAAPTEATALDVPDANPAKQSSGLSAKEPEPWWQLFQTEALNEAVSTSLDQNRSLRAAWFRLRRAQEAVAVAGAQRYPSVNAGVGGGYSRRESPLGGVVEGELLRVSAGASYEVDLWRRVASEIENREFLRDASGLDYETLAISTAAAVCDAWFIWQAQQQFVALLQTQVVTAESALQTLESRYRQGIGDLLDVYQQRQLIASLEAQLPGLIANASLAENRLTVLMGEMPYTNRMDASTSFPELDPLDGEIDWIMQAEGRPDVRARAARRDAAEASWRALRRARLPEVKVEAMAESQADGETDLFDEQNAQALLTMSVPLVDGGRRRAAARQAESAFNEEIEVYEETLRQAVREIRDAYLQETSQAERIERLRLELDAARETLALSTDRYRAGLIEYLNVLTAQSRVYTLERALVAAEQQRLSFRIQYYRTIAGKGSQHE